MLVGLSDVKNHLSKLDSYLSSLGERITARKQSIDRKFGAQGNFSQVLDKFNNPTKILKQDAAVISKSAKEKIASYEKSVSARALQTNNKNLNSNDDPSLNLENITYPRNSLAALRQIQTSKEKLLADDNVKANSQLEMLASSLEAGSQVANADENLSLINSLDALKARLNELDATENTDGFNAVDELSKLDQKLAYGNNAKNTAAPSAVASTPASQLVNAKDVDLNTEQGLVAEVTPAASETVITDVANTGRNSKLPANFDDYLEKVKNEAEREFKVSFKPGLIESIIKHESNYDPKAVSKVGARGLMQLMPATAKEMGVLNSLNPYQNVRGGTRYVAKLLNEFEGDIPKTLAAYNSGPNTVKQYMGVPPFPETQNYVSNILTDIN
jgi:soluble lytic murein transglycosylase-like protein